MSEEMWEMLSGVLTRLERMALALEAIQKAGGGAANGPGSGALADANPGAAPGGDSGPGPGDEPTQFEAAAGLGWCGSCGSASSTDAQSCEACGAGLAPGASTN